MAWLCFRRRTSLWVGTTQILLWSLLLLSLLKEIVIDIHTYNSVYFFEITKMPWTFNIRTVLPKKGRRIEVSKEDHSTFCGGKAARLGYGESFHQRQSTAEVSQLSNRIAQGLAAGLKEVVGYSQLLHLHKHSFYLLTAFQGWTTSETAWFEGWSYQFISFLSPSNVAFSKEKVSKTRVSGEFELPWCLVFHIGLKSR